MTTSNMRILVVAVCAAALAWTAWSALTYHQLKLSLEARAFFLECRSDRMLTPEAFGRFHAYSEAIDAVSPEKLSRILGRTWRPCDRVCVRVPALLSGPDWLAVCSLVLVTVVALIGASGVASRAVHIAVGGNVDRNGNVRGSPAGTRWADWPALAAIVSAPLAGAIAWWCLFPRPPFRRTPDFEALLVPSLLGGMIYGVVLTTFLSLLQVAFIHRSCRGLSRRPDRATDQSCRFCRYSLVSVSGTVCPECGFPIGGSFRDWMNRWYSGAPLARLAVRFGIIAASVAIISSLTYMRGHVVEITDGWLRRVVGWSTFGTNATIGHCCVMVPAGVSVEFRTDEGEAYVTVDGTPRTGWRCTVEWRRRNGSTELLTPATSSLGGGDSALLSYRIGTVAELWVEPRSYVAQPSSPRFRVFVLGDVRGCRKRLDHE